MTVPIEALEAAESIGFYDARRNTSRGVLATMDRLPSLSTADTMDPKVVALVTGAYSKGWWDGHAVPGPHKTDKDMFMNALGALMASLMEPEFDTDLCENAR